MPTYKASKKYFGDVAAAYDDRRAGRDRWMHEQAIVAAYIQELPQGSRIADVPFGTGRFAPLYIERGLKVFGADISEDMIIAARDKIGSNDNFCIKVAAAEDLPFEDRSVDYLISHRFIKWLPSSIALRAVVKEFARITNREMLIQVKLTQGPLWNLRRRVLRTVRACLKPGQARSRTFSPEELGDAFYENGFKIRQISHHPEVSEGVAYYLVERV